MPKPADCIQNASHLQRGEALTSRSGRKPVVKIRAPVAEEAPIGPIALNFSKVEGVDEHALVLIAEALDKRAGVIGDKGITVEELRRRAVLLQADAVGGYDRQALLPRGPAWRAATAVVSSAAS